jgi:hypothetical protein
MYEMIQDIVNHTKEDHPDYANLVNCLKEITAVVDYINEQKREVELAKQIEDLQNAFEGMEVRSFLPFHLFTISA